MSSGLILEIVEGPGSGTRFPVDGRAEIGRSDTATFPLADPLVSRHHAIVEPRREGLVVEDLGSLNGTFVNGGPIYGATVIHQGDQLLVGVTVLEVRSREAVAERPSAVKPVPRGLAGRSRPVPPTAPTHSLDPLLDSSVKKQARAAPLAVFLLIVIVVSIVLTIR